jgi:hypothetical protein
MPKIGKKCTCWQSAKKRERRTSVWTSSELKEAYLAFGTTPSHYCKAPQIKASLVKESLNVNAMAC